MPVDTPISCKQPRRTRGISAPQLRPADIHASRSHTHTQFLYTTTGVCTTIFALAISGFQRSPRGTGSWKWIRRRGKTPGEEVPDFLEFLIIELASSGHRCSSPFTLWIILFNLNVICIRHERKLTDDTKNGGRRITWHQRSRNFEGVCVWIPDCHEDLTPEGEKWSNHKWKRERGSLVISFNRDFLKTVSRVPWFRFIFQPIFGCLAL